MKSNYKVIAEGIATGKISKVELPTSRVNHRRLTVDEIKEVMSEEFKAARAAASEKVQSNKHFGDAELAKEIDWVKALDLKEFFKR